MNKVFCVSLARNKAHRGGKNQLTNVSNTAKAQNQMLTISASVYQGLLDAKKRKKTCLPVYVSIKYILTIGNLGQVRAAAEDKWKGEKMRVHSLLSI